MKRWQLLLLYVLVSAVSVGTVGMLLYFQFVRGEPFFDSFEEVSLRGTVIYQRATQQQHIKNIRIVYRRVSIDPSNAVLFHEQGGNRKKLKTLRYEKSSGMLRIYFEGGVVLIVHRPHEQQDTLFIHISNGGGFSEERYTHLRLPLICSPLIRCEPRNNQRLHISNATDSLQLLLPPEATMNTKKGEITLSLTEPNKTIVFASMYSVESAERLRRFFGLYPYNDSTVQSLLERYIDTAYQSWSSERYLASEGEWIGRDGEPHFLEETLLAYLAEGWRRQDFTESYSAMRRSARQHSDQIGIRSALYMGNSVEQFAKLIQGDQRRKQLLHAFINSRDLSLFADYSLLELGYFRSDNDLHSQFLNYITSIDWYRLELTSALHLLRLAVVTRDPLLLPLYDIAYYRILPAIRVLNQNLFLAQNNRAIDLFHTIDAGWLLQEIGNLKEDLLLQESGSMLIASALSLMDNNAYIPRLLHVDGERVRRVQGIIAAEHIYPFIVESGLYPRQYLIDLGEGERSTLWSPLKLEIEEQGNGRIVINYPYTDGFFFYMVLARLPRPRTIAIANQPYPNNSDFELHLRGRYWQAESQSLHIKIEGTAQSNTIVIR